MKRLALLYLALTAGVTALAQQTGEWRPSVAEDNKAATYDATIQFILTTLQDQAETRLVFPKSQNMMADMNVDLVNVQSPTHCTLDSVQIVRMSSAVDRWSYHVDLSKVDPLSIAVISIASNPAHYNVNVAGTDNGQIGTGNVFERDMLKNKAPTIQDALSATCQSKDKGCKDNTGPVPTAYYSLTNIETAKRLARALFHASLLCGGTKAVSPF